MSVPAGFSEFELAQAMHTWLGSMAAALGWDPATLNYREPTIDALQAYGVSSLADATDTQKLRLLARRAVWRSAVEALAVRVDSQSDAGALKSSQLQAQALKALALAEQDAAPYDLAAGIQVTEIRQTADPYAIPEAALAW